MFQDEHIQTLMDLGLGLLQAKIYLTLAKLGKAEIKTISQASTVARQDIYRIMPALQKLGLAEKILATPNMYKATPIKEGYYLLLQNKTQQHTELQKKTIALIKSPHESNYKTATQDEDSQFVVTSSRALFFKKLAEREKTVQTSIEGVGKWEDTKSVLFCRFQDFNRATKRGVRIRIITEKHEGDKSIQKIIQTLTTNSLFEIRCLPAPIPVTTIIHDGTEVNMRIAIPPDNDVPSLWSNNPQFAKAMTTYFEELWNKAQDASETLPRKSVKLKPPQTRSAQPASKLFVK